MNTILTHPIITLAVVFGAVALILAWFVFDLRRKWHALFGTRSETPAESLVDALERIARAEQRLELIQPRITALEDIGMVSIQKIGFMRFNPFEHTGGDQSFAIALLDRENNGLVLSSLYTREGVRVYAKQIQNGASKHPLSDEEKSVVASAVENRGG